MTWLLLLPINRGKEGKETIPRSVESTRVFLPLRWVHEKSCEPLLLSCRILIVTSGSSGFYSLLPIINRIRAEPVTRKVTHRELMHGHLMRDSPTILWSPVAFGLLALEQAALFGLERCQQGVQFPMNARFVGEILAR